MKTQKYGCKDNDDIVTVTVPDHIELPAQITVRYPDEDFKDRTFWWHYAR